MTTEVLLALLQLGDGLFPAGGFAHSFALETYAQEGRVREAEGRVPEAHELLQQAVKLQPKSYELLFDCARFAAQHENWNESIDFLQRADAVSPDRREVLLKLTLALLKVRFREQAVAVAKRLNAIAPDDPDAQYSSIRPHPSLIWMRRRRPGRTRGE